MLAESRNTQGGYDWLKFVYHRTERWKEVKSVLLLVGVVNHKRRSPFTTLYHEDDVKGNLTKELDVETGRYSRSRSKRYKQVIG